MQHIIIEYDNKKLSTFPLSLCELRICLLPSFQICVLQWKCYFAPANPFIIQHNGFRTFSTITYCC